MKKNVSLLVIVGVFLLVSGWYAQSVVADMTSFNDWDKPKEVAALWRAGLFGLGAHDGVTRLGGPGSLASGRRR